jgi:hypothetical protein
MLDFYLGTGGIENPGKHLGGISAEGIYWLQKNGLLKKGATGHLPEDDPESLPYYDDAVLNLEQVKRMYDKFKARAEHIRQTPGFRNADVDNLEKILVEAIENNTGLSTIAD